MVFLSHRDEQMIHSGGFFDQANASFGERFDPADLTTEP